MSKPTRGSIPPPPKPQQQHQVPAGPRPKLPPRATPIRPLRLPQAIPQPSVESIEAQQASEASNTRTLWEKIIRRKKLVYAIAFGVVVVAGSIGGARLKEIRQEYARRSELEEAARKLAESAVITGDAKEESLTATVASAVQASRTEAANTSPATVQKSVGYDVDVARQITLLEDRKALLNRQRNTIEQKIQRLRERTARRQEMESRRPQSVQVDR